MSGSSEVIQAAQGNMLQRGYDPGSSRPIVQAILLDLIYAAELLGPDVVNATVLDIDNQELRGEQ